MINASFGNSATFKFRDESFIKNWRKYVEVYEEANASDNAFFSKSSQIHSW